MDPNAEDSRQVGSKAKLFIENEQKLSIGANNLSKSDLKTLLKIPACQIF